MLKRAHRACSVFMVVCAQCCVNNASGYVHFISWTLSKIPIKDTVLFFRKYKNKADQIIASCINKNKGFLTTCNTIKTLGQHVMQSPFVI